MAAARARAGKVTSSKRISVPVGPRSCRQRAAVRKVSATSADSGYSLCSSDSEDQVLVLHEGLDRCAALLQDILHSDVRENTMKSHRATFPRAHVKSSVKAKKSIARKPDAVSRVYKERGFVMKPVPSAACDFRSPRVAASSPAVPAIGPESGVLFNCRLPTSTPTLSPQHPERPQGSGYEGHRQSLPPGGAAHFPSCGATESTAASAPPTMCSVPLLPMSAATSSSQPIHHQADMSQLTCKKALDCELLHCLAEHLAKVQRTETSGQSQQLRYPTEHEGERPVTQTETSSDEEETQARAAARDISCQTSFSNQKNGSPEKAERKIRTVQYLLGEIKALVAEQDGEALRLISELERSLSLLPAIVASTNVHAEIALALQPLRSENAQLRRRLRILNQQLRDRERTERSDEHHYQLASLQSMNETLQQQLMESEESLQFLQNKNQELLKMIEAQGDENRKHSEILQEKDQEILQIQQQIREKMEVEEVVGKMKSAQFKLESMEKENQILEITLRQRDAEVSRLREVTRTLQSSMARLLCDLGKDKTKSKPGGPLTQATLDNYEKQLRSDQCTASTSIISYLKRLEMDQMVQKDPPAPYNSLTSDPNDDSALSKFNYPRPESTTTSLPPFSPLKPGAEGNSDSCCIMGDEYKPDETTYLPLASSPHKADFTPSLQNMCTPPKSCGAARELGNELSHAKICNSERNPTTQKNLFRIQDTIDQPTKLHDPDLSLPSDPSRSHPPLLQHLGSLHINDHRPTRHVMQDVMSGRADWSIASFSTFTSHDEQDFRNGLAALDANIATLQRTLQISSSKK